MIISVFIDVNDATSRSNLFLDLFSKSMPQKRGQQKTINTPDTWRVYDLLPDLKSFYTYKGSLVRSPCTENVTWIVMDNPCNCSNIFYDNLKKIISRESRSIQPINNRKVYFNLNTNSKNKRNYGDSFRCYTEKEFRKSCAKLTSHKDIIDAKHRHLLLVTITISIFLLLVLFILWLVQQDFFTNTSDKISKFLSTKLFIKRQ